MANFDLVKENIEYEQLQGQATTDTVIRGEHLIPDTHPDVEEVLVVDARPMILTKEILQDKVYVEGQMNFDVTYVAVVDEQRCIHNVRYSTKFSSYVDIDGAAGHMYCDVGCFVEHMDYSIMNERKLSLNGILKLKCDVYKLFGFEIVKDIATTSNVQMLKNNTEIDKIASKIKEDMTASAHFKIPMDKPQIGRVLRCVANVHKRNIKLIEGKVIVESFVEFKVLYVCEDNNMLHALVEDVFISRDIEAENVNSYMNIASNIDVVDVEYNVKEDDLGEARIIDAEALIRLNAKVMSKEEFALIEDIYSPAMSLNVERKEYPVNVIHGANNHEFIVKENIDLSSGDDKPTEIVMINGKVNVIDKRIMDDKAIVEGLLTVEVMYKTSNNGEVASTSEEIPFTANVDIEGSKNDMEVMATASLEGLEANIEANTIAVKGVISVYARTSYYENREFITQIEEVDGETPVKKASVTIYVVQDGDTLWKIAKKYNTTMEDILKLNPMDQPNILRIGQKLIIPGRLAM